MKNKMARKDARLVVIILISITLFWILLKKIIYVIPGVVVYRILVHIDGILSAPGLILNILTGTLCISLSCTSHQHFIGRIIMFLGGIIFYTIIAFLVVKKIRKE